MELFFKMIPSPFISIKTPLEKLRIIMSEHGVEIGSIADFITRYTTSGNGDALAKMFTAGDEEIFVTESDLVRYVPFDVPDDARTAVYRDLRVWCKNTVALAKSKRKRTAEDKLEEAKEIVIDMLDEARAKIGDKFSEISGLNEERIATIKAGMGLVNHEHVYGVLKNLSAETHSTCRDIQQRMSHFHFDRSTIELRTLSNILKTACPEIPAAMAFTKVIAALPEDSFDELNAMLVRGVDAATISVACWFGVVEGYVFVEDKAIELPSYLGL